MASQSTPTPQKVPAKKPAAKKAPAKKAGSSRVAALASKLATSPGSVKATASLPVVSGDTAAATASLLGLPPTVITAPVPSATLQAENTTSSEQPEAAHVTEQANGDTTAAGPVGEGRAGEPPQVPPASVDEPADDALMAEPDPVPTAVPTAVPAAVEDAADTIESAAPAEPTALNEPIQSARVEPTESVAPVAPVEPARRPEPKKSATKSTTQSAAKTASHTGAKAVQPPSTNAVPADVDAEQPERLDDLVWALSSPEHSLDQQHDRISKLTLELPIPLVDVLNRWELDQVRRTGRRLYRERLIDLALAELPSNMDKVVAMARDLPAWLKYAETEQVGSRVRAPVALELKVMKQELKLRREKGTYVRHIYAVALLNFLTSYDVPVEEPVR